MVSEECYRENPNWTQLFWSACFWSYPVYVLSNLHNLEVVKYDMYGNLIQNQYSESHIVELQLSFVNTIKLRLFSTETLTFEPILGGSRVLVALPVQESPLEPIQ
ncbi:unnamed protein product [Thelazia callipaeda]|uniref:C2 domain-containing protein n=1 Tax=Thelazia callipaeda TaxID=103827 RepID=A0A0N5CWU4_THECL|nr:unnamed protein product [Thelazia callipaeda]